MVLKYGMSIKGKFVPAFKEFNYLRHEGVRRSGYTYPHFADLGTSFTPRPLYPLEKVWIEGWVGMAVVCLK
jgi:hypothetical protein